MLHFLLMRLLAACYTGLQVSWEWCVVSHLYWHSFCKCVPLQCWLCAAIFFVKQAERYMVYMIELGKDSHSSDKELVAITNQSEYACNKNVIRIDLHCSFGYIWSLRQEPHCCFTWSLEHPGPWMQLYVEASILYMQEPTIWWQYTMMCFIICIVSRLNTHNTICMHY